MSAFSLPTQRCFQYCILAEGILDLFSAYAEVFLDRGCPDIAEMPFLCLRRGVSRKAVISEHIYSFSLPTQRCFSRRAR